MSEIVCIVPLIHFLTLKVIVVDWVFDAFTNVPENWTRVDKVLIFRLSIDKVVNWK